MTTRRAAPIPEADETPRKHSRIQVNVVSERVASFDDIHQDCLVLILSYLTAQDMDSVAVCSRQCREARNHDSLDQTRTGTLVWTKKTSIYLFCNKIIESRQVFTGERTRLNVVGLEKSKNENLEWSDVMERVNVDHLTLEHVTSVDCSSDASTANSKVQLLPLIILSRSLVNLREVDLSSVKPATVGTSVMDLFCKNCPRLTKITWSGCNQGIFLCGFEFRNAYNLTDLYLDGAELFLIAFPDGLVNPRDHFFLMKCRRLERLSMKNAFVQKTFSDGVDPVSQDIIIKMVRRHPTLRWLRSDLTAENVVMLQRERPEITFVTE